MFFERAIRGNIGIIVHVDFRMLYGQEDLDEFMDLSKSAGIMIRHVICANKNNLHSHTFVGGGKLAEIAAIVNSENVNIVLFNNILSSSQERNLESELQCSVIDRVGLILDIFSQRARTYEGKLQVELAQLEYISTRLIRGWTHLERQKGGIGLRGPGETQLETDRRLLSMRIKKIKGRLEKVLKQRKQGQYSRENTRLSTIAVVGYTNAGKSTLFNSISNSNIYTADQLFATLDPTLRRLYIKGVGEIVVTDTVGFIRDLPHRLINAFKATLEEVLMADLLLHIVDSSAENRLDNIIQVNEVLNDIGVKYKKTIIIYNKIDLLVGILPKIDYDMFGEVDKIWISAREGWGIGQLFKVISKILENLNWKGNILISYKLLKLRSYLYRMNNVKIETYNNKGDIILNVSITKSNILKIEKQFSINWKNLVYNG